MGKFLTLRWGSQLRPHILGGLVILSTFALALSVPEPTLGQPQNGQTGDSPRGPTRELADPLDPFEFLRGLGGGLDLTDTSQDDTKTVEQLTDEAEILMDGPKSDLLTARTKLLTALRKDPKSIRAHFLLGNYYLAHVGHYRLALKYAKRAVQLFEAENGKSPYKPLKIRSMHAQLLALLTSARLELDSYEDALKTLDEVEELGYLTPWYFPTRAWVLFKMGRLDDAIRFARQGLFMAKDSGRTLNMLGILLSVKNEPEQALSVLKKALEIEMSLGSGGSPSTPLNNIGEVYREMFDDKLSAETWLKVRGYGSLDGCEHILPTLNLVLLRIEQLRLGEAGRSLDWFEQCIRQFPLRNAEEHRGLLQLARGRIAVLGGDGTNGIPKLEQALDKRQWFGKIGTSVNDMRAASTLSLSQALFYRANTESTRITSGPMDWLRRRENILEDRIRSRWLARRVLQILIEDLKNFEDLDVRHTDSLLEYPSLGYLFRYIPRATAQQLITGIKKVDTRPAAQVFYDAYLAENELFRGDAESAIETLFELRRKMRPMDDEFLRQRTSVLLLSALDPDDERLSSLSAEVGRSIGGRALIRLEGAKLPINFDGVVSDAAKLLNRSAFDIRDDLQLDMVTVSSQSKSGYSFELRSRTSNAIRIKVSGDDLRATINRFADEVFRNPEITIPEEKALGMTNSSGSRE